MQPELIKLKNKQNQFIFAFKNDAITNDIIKYGEYDHNTLDSIRAILGVIKPRISLDVGANIGNHALVISQYTKKLIAFEPVDFIADALRQTLALNKVSNLEFHNVALSDVTGVQDIYVSENGNLGCTSLNKIVNEVSNQKINTDIGDNYLKPEDLCSVDFIKIDVEGYEPQALLGLKNVIKQSQPLILLEWGSDFTHSGFNKLSLFTQLFSTYKVYSLTYSYNKKVHKKNLAGHIGRLYYKIFANTWCLSDFDTDTRYSNIFLVPPRFKDAFKKLKYLSADVRV